MSVVLAVCAFLIAHDLLTRRYAFAETWHALALSGLCGVLVGVYWRALTLVALLVGLLLAMSASS